MDFKADFYIGAYDDSFPNGEAYTANEFYEDLRNNSRLNVYMVLFGGGFDPLRIAVIAEHDDAAVEAALELIQARIQANLYNYDGDPFEEEEIAVMDVRRDWFNHGNTAIAVMQIANLLGEPIFLEAVQMGLDIYPEKKAAQLYRSYGIGSRGIEIKTLKSVLLTYADFLSQLYDNNMAKDGMNILAGRIILACGPLHHHMPNTILR